MIMNDMKAMDYKSDTKTLTLNEYQTMDGVNLFRAELFKIFENVQEIIIISTIQSGKISFPFSLLQLLQLVNNVASLRKITIKASRLNSQRGGMGDESWISILWQQAAETITKYNESGFLIHYQQIRNGVTLLEDCVLIQRNEEEIA